MIRYFFFTILVMNMIAIKANSNDAHSFSFESINGDEINLNDYNGKTILIVNTASRCGFTGQYKGLQELWTDYKNKGLIILGVPSNSFKQELGDEKSVSDFCELNYGVNFPLTKIVKVIGKNKHPFYSWVKDEYGIVPKWNFYKILLDSKGKVISSYSSLTKPKSEKLIRDIENNIKG